MKLADLAVRSQANGYKGLFGFMTLVRRLIENEEEPFHDGETAAGSGAVKIMSIHKSKGLEFPVVILADTAKRFNRKDAAAPLLVHPTLGIGAKRTELDRRIEYPTLARLAVARKLSAEMLSEELRILYVAMTRAREKLIIVGTFKDADKELLKLARDAGSPVAPQALENAAGLSSFILLPAMTRPEAECLRLSPVPVDADCGMPWDIRKIKVGETSENSRAAAAAVPERAEPEPGALEEARRKLSFVYPYISASGIPSKLTATGLKGRFADYEAAENAEPLAAPAKRAPVIRPAFIANRTSLSPAERGYGAPPGDAVYRFRPLYDLDGVRDELRRLKEKAFLSRRPAEAVNPEKILAFFISDLGKRVLNADEIYREFKFSLLVPAEEYYPGAKTGDGDEILLQGVVDCCMREREALHVIDFKTDAVTLENIEEKTRQYAPQLAAYGRAWRASWDFR
jgi:ATP-dependent helicase/nuclease subunit A